MRLDDQRLVHAAQYFARYSSGFTALLILRLPRLPNCPLSRVSPTGNQRLAKASKKGGQECIVWSVGSLRVGRSVTLARYLPLRCVRLLCKGFDHPAGSRDLRAPRSLLSPGGPLIGGFSGVTNLVRAYLILMSAAVR